MAVLTSRLIISLVDRVSGPARTVASSLRGIGAAGKGIERGYATAVAPIVGRVRKMSEAVALSNPLAGTAAIAGGFGIFKAHQDLLKWSNVLNKIKAANPEVIAEDLKRFEDTAFGIGRDRRILNPTDVLVGVNTLVRAGMKAKAISKEVMNPIADAAMLAGESVEWMSEKFVNLTAQFGMRTDSVDHASESFKKLADLAQYVSQEAPGSYRDFVDAMSYAGQGSKFIKGGADFLAGAYISLDKAGVRGMRAGVTLRSFLNSLAKPKASARAMFAQMGLDTDKFLLRGKAVDAGQIVAGLKAQFGQDFGKQAANIQKVLDANLPSERTEALLYRVIERAWTGKKKGGKLRPQDAEKVKKALNSAVASGVSQFDLENFIQQAAEKGMTLGQLIKIVEGRQALNLQALFGEDIDEETGQKILNTPLNRLKGFSRGVAEKQAKEMEKGYAGAVGKLQFAWWAFLKRMDESGIIDKVTAGLDRFGTALTNIADLKFSWGDLLIGAAVLLPFLGVLMRLGSVAVLAAKGLFALGSLAAGAIAALLGLSNPVGWAILAVAAVAALGVYFRKELGEMFNSIGAWFSQNIVGWFSQKLASINSALSEGAGMLLYNVGATLIQSLWDGMKAKFSELFGWLKGVGSAIGGALRGSIPGGAAPSLNDGIPAPQQQGYRPGAGGVIVQQAFHVTVGAGADAAETARKIRDELSGAFREAARGVYADIGVAPA